MIRRTFCVTWTQSHRAEVLTNSKEEAKTVALGLNDRHTFEGVHNMTVREVSR